MVGWRLTGIDSSLRIRDLAFSRFVASSFHERLGLFIPYGFIFVNEFGRTLPGTARFHYGFSKVKLAAAGDTTFGIEDVQSL
jgi:hypothetical protein